jgi:hypothetical protein
MLSVDVSGLRTNLSSTFISERKSISYPYIYIPKFAEEIALVVTCVKPGGLPIVLMDTGTLKQVGTCAYSAVGLAKLARVYQFEIIVADDVKKMVRSVSDILEVLVWMDSLSSS